MIHTQGKKKIVATASKQGSSSQKLYMDKVVEEYREIFSLPMRVPLHYQVKNSIDLTMGTLLPNGTIYQHFVTENDEIKR